MDEVEKTAFIEEGVVTDAVAAEEQTVVQKIDESPQDDDLSELTECVQSLAVEISDSVLQGLLQKFINCARPGLRAL